MPRGVKKVDAVGAGDGADLPENFGKMSDGSTMQPPEKNDEEGLMDILKTISVGMGNLTQEVAGLGKRVRDIETGGANKFKDAPKQEDIESASETRKSIDPKISAIVDEMLGEDFGVEVRPLGDRPGFRFTVIVPQRLSDNVTDRRPVKNVDANGQITGEYMKDAAGNVVFQDYVPEDRRSRILSSTDSYDAVKNHCEKVRGHIVATFSKNARPLPEFKVK